MILLNAETTPEGTVQVIFRMGRLLDVLTRKTPANLKELSDTAKLPKTTVYRIMRSLEGENIVVKTPQGFLLGPRLTQWQPPIDVFSRLKEITRPLLHHIAERSGETASLFARIPGARQCLAVVQSSQVIRHVLEPGDLFPLGIGAGGKLLISHLSKTERNRALAATVVRFPDVEIQYSTLDAELDAMRLVGHAASLEEREAGLASVSWLIPGLPAMCLTISGPSTRFDQDSLGRFIDLLRDAVGRLDQDLLGFQDVVEGGYAH